MESSQVRTRAETRRGMIDTSFQNLLGVLQLSITPPPFPLPYHVQNFVLYGFYSCKLDGQITG